LNLWWNHHTNHYKYLWWFRLLAKNTTKNTTPGEKHHIPFYQWGGATIEYHGRQCLWNINVSIVYPSQKHREYYLASMPVGILMTTVNLGFSMVTGYRGLQGCRPVHSLIHMWLGYWYCISNPTVEVDKKIVLFSVNACWDWDFIRWSLRSSCSVCSLAYDLLSETTWHNLCVLFI